MKKIDQNKSSGKSRLNATFFAPKFVIVCSMLLLIASQATAADQLKCRYGMVGKLPLKYHGASMGVVAEGQINNTPAEMLIDTGSTNTLMTRFAVDKRAIPLEPTMHTYTGVGGGTRLYMAAVKQFQVGPINTEYGHGQLQVVDEMGKRPEHDAVVGANFLMEMDVELNLAEKQLKFFSPKNCENTFLGYWDKAALSVPLMFEVHYKRPIVEVELNGIKMRALLDTGATGSFVSTEGASRAGVKPDTADGAGRETYGFGKKIVKMHDATFKTFSLGSETIQNAHLEILEHKSDGFDVILGTDFMRAHRILFAVSQMKMYFSYIGGEPFNNEQSNHWIELEADAGNGYAQYFMARPNLESAKPEWQAVGRAWMDKSLANNTPIALLYMARQRSREGKYADSVDLYERLLERDAFDMQAQLEVFVARLKAGQVDQAKPALAKAMARFKWPKWPAPITGYYLDEVTLDDLLRQAGSERDVAKYRTCEVLRHAGALQEALGQADAAKTLAARAKTECPSSGMR